MSKSSPLPHGKNNYMEGKRTACSPCEKKTTTLVRNMRKKPKKKTKENTRSCDLTVCACRDAHISKNDFTKDRGLKGRRKPNETIHRKKRISTERHNISSTKQKRPEDISSRHLWLISYGERTITSTVALGYALLGPSRHVRTYYCMP